MQAALTLALVVTAVAEATAFDTIATDLDGVKARSDAAEVSATEIAEPADWSVLDWHAGADPGPSSSSLFSRWSMPAQQRNAAAAWSRTEGANGSTAVSVSGPLQVPWGSKIGAEFNLPPRTPEAPGPVDPARLLSRGAADSSAGAAWASMSMPSYGFGKTALDARLDATEALCKASVSASNAMALSRQLSLTLQTGYAATETFASLPLDALGGSHVYTTEQVARLTILPTQTKIAATVSMSTADERWLPALSAEQTLFKGASIAGSISQSAEGLLNTSILARFQRRW